MGNVGRRFLLLSQDHICLIVADFGFLAFLRSFNFVMGEISTCGHLAAGIWGTICHREGICTFFMERLAKE